MADPGQHLAGRYRLTAVLGQGGFGQVYRAEELADPSTCWAVKELNLSFTSPEEASEALGMLEREQKILSWVSHAGIVTRREVLVENNTLYLVMELVEGDTLEAVLERYPHSVPQSAVVELADQVLDVLAYLHSQKPYPIIFRDLKPSNLILTRTGRVKVIDFGIARLYDPTSAATSGSLSPRVDPDAAPAWTRQQARVQDTICMGTPGYAAPEQYPGSGTQSDGRADIYALGVLMHHLLTRRDPGSLGIPLPSIRETLPELDPDLDAIIGRATALNRAARFQSASGFRTALRHLRYRTWRESVGKGPHELQCVVRPELRVTDYAQEINEALARTDSYLEELKKPVPGMAEQLEPVLRWAFPVGGVVLAGLGWVVAGAYGVGAAAVATGAGYAWAKRGIRQRA